MSKSLKDLKIVFMGTPEFAVASLDALLQAGSQIVGVITAPDKSAGRGMKLSESAIKKYAVKKGLLLLQPEKLKSPEFVQALAALQADVQVVVAFRMLPDVIWNMPPMGTINLHGSLLPQYRGAAPINWAVINGEKETGVTTFKLQHAIDTGNILLQESLPINDDETAGEVHDRMKIIGAQLLVKTMQELASGTLKEKPQISQQGDQQQWKLAPKIFTDTSKIDWNKSVTDVYNLVRGLSPFPGAFTSFQEKLLKIYRSKKEFSSPSVSPGAFLTDQKTYLKFAAADGYIHVIEILLEGKKKMMVDEFLRGYRFLDDPVN